MFPNVYHFNLNDDELDDNFKSSVIINLSNKYKNTNFFNFLIKDQEQLTKSVKVFYKNYKNLKKITILYANDKQLYLFYKEFIKNIAKIENEDMIKDILRNNGIKCF